MPLLFGLGQRSPLVMYKKKKNNTTLRVQVAGTLLPFLMEKMSTSRTSAKGLLSRRVVMVNGSVQTRHDMPLNVGDEVMIVAAKGNTELRHPKLRIVYEDSDLIVVEKKVGLLTAPVNKVSSEATALGILKAYVRHQDPKGGVYVVHRLDRETSGLLVFAKSQELQEYMRTYWADLVRARVYVSIIEGVPEKKEDTITTWFTEDEQHAMVYSSPVDDGGKKAVTHYKVLSSVVPEDAKAYSMVELRLETGRTNQIRVHMASIGHPVVGDRKYGHGNEQSPMDRLALHATELAFVHPVSEQVVKFTSPIPREFLALCKRSRSHE